MNGFVKSLPVITLLIATAACNVTEEGNGSTTLSVDENRVEQGVDVVENGAAKATDAAAEALQNAGPTIEKSASDIQERAGRVVNKVEQVDVDVDVDTNKKPTTNAQ